MNYKKYIESADRGDFRWEVIDEDEMTGKILEEESTYKGKSSGILIRTDENGYEIEIDNLINEPFYIYNHRSTRKLAREFSERIVKNDREGNWKENLKYKNY